VVACRSAAVAAGRGGAADVASGEGRLGGPREDDEGDQGPASSLRARLCHPSRQPDQPAIAWPLASSSIEASRRSGYDASGTSTDGLHRSGLLISWPCCVRLLGPRPVPSLRRLAGHQVVHGLRTTEQLALALYAASSAIVTSRC